jgi:hypothetical protein
MSLLDEHITMTQAMAFSAFKGGMMGVFIW